MAFGVLLLHHQNNSHKLLVEVYATTYKLSQKQKKMAFLGQKSHRV